MRRCNRRILTQLTLQFFEKGRRVYALYPQTTCFYPAVVHDPPRADRSEYVLHFDEDDYEDGRVRYQDIPVRFVVELPVLKGRTK